MYASLTTLLPDNAAQGGLRPFEPRLRPAPPRQHYVEARGRRQQPRGFVDRRLHHTKFTERYTIVQMRRQEKLTRRIQDKQAKAATRAKDLKVVEINKEAAA